MLKDGLKGDDVLAANVVVDYPQLDRRALSHELNLCVCQRSQVQSGRAGKKRLDVIPTSHERNATWVETITREKHSHVGELRTAVIVVGAAAKPSVILSQCLYIWSSWLGSEGLGFSTETRWVAALTTCIQCTAGGS